MDPVAPAGQPPRPDQGPACPGGRGRLGPPDAPPLPLLPRRVVPGATEARPGPDPRPPTPGRRAPRPRRDPRRLAPHRPGSGPPGAREPGQSDARGRGAGAGRRRLATANVWPGPRSRDPGDTPGYGPATPTP